MTASKTRPEVVPSPALLPPLWAFWSYDTYPFVLGGLVERFDEKGRVYVLSYQGWFTPIKILPHPAGEGLNDMLKKLVGDYRRAREDFEKPWRKLVEGLVPEAFAQKGS